MLPGSKRPGIILSYICPLMYMNNPLCKKKAVITSSNKLRTYTSARYYTEAEIPPYHHNEEGGQKNEDFQRKSSRPRNMHLAEALVSHGGFQYARLVSDGNDVRR